MNHPPLNLLVRKLKLDGGIRSHPAVFVDINEDGLWLFSPAGTMVQTETVPWRQPADGIQLFAVDGTFVAWCWAAAPTEEGEIWSRPWVSVDVADTVRFWAGRAEFVDLELDLWCGADEAGIVDQDDLAASLSSGLLTPERARAAEETAERLYEQLKHGIGHTWDRYGWTLLEDVTAPIPGGAGWHLDPLTLDTVVTDPEALRSGLVGDPAGEAILQMWTGGADLAAARLDALLAEEPGSVRLRALRADCERFAGRPDAAVASLRALRVEVAGEAREPAVVQHLGKALFALGRYEEAAEAFEAAMRLRATAPENLRESSSRAAWRANQLAHAFWPTST